MSNDILERIYQDLGNLVWTCNMNQTYVDEDYPWSGILDAASFVIRSTKNVSKGYSMVQLVFGRYMILPIKYMVDW